MFTSLGVTYDLVSLSPSFAKKKHNCKNNYPFVKTMDSINWFNKIIFTIKKIKWFLWIKSN